MPAKKIQMVDLRSQYLNIKSEIDQAVGEVVDSCAFINGPAVKRFQENLGNYLGVKHVIPCANGTDALQVSLMALGLKPGDEVITTTFTFIATAEVIALLQLQPVIVDIDPDTFNIDVEAIRNAVTPNTKAIIPVHLFGQCADMETIMEIAKEYDLKVVEDACQAIGADYLFSNGDKRKAGTIGDTGCVSFFPSKNLGAYGDGGAIFTNDDALADQIRVVVNHGMKVRYYHDYVGVNSRLDSIQAAILNVKLRHLDDYTANRQRAAKHYDEALSGHENLVVPPRDPKSTHVFHQYTLRIVGKDRLGLQEFLNLKGIPAMIYYPVPLHLQKAYLSDRSATGSLPVSEEASAHVLSLPMHSELDDEQLNYITTAVLEYLDK